MEKISCDLIELIDDGSMKIRKHGFYMNYFCNKDITLIYQLFMIGG